MRVSQQRKGLGSGGGIFLEHTTNGRRDHGGTGFLNPTTSKLVALVYTSRALVRGSDAAASLEIGRLVSSALVKIVRSINAAPSWVVAKGGITSSDIATQGLDVFRAEVLGQILPGVPVWRTSIESRWPNLVYVVFPGNVGGPQALAEVVNMLSG